MGRTDDEFRQNAWILGETPLPKYIKRKPEAEDKERYQTVYAKHEGAVAAPTAGLHFSIELIKRLEIKGIRFAEITLHTGLGTFRPIEVEDLSKHKMMQNIITSMILPARSWNKPSKAVIVSAQWALQPWGVSNPLIQQKNYWSLPKAGQISLFILLTSQYCGCTGYQSSSSQNQLADNDLRFCRLWTGNGSLQKAIKINIVSSVMETRC